MLLVTLLHSTAFAPESLGEGDELKAPWWCPLWELEYLPDSTILYYCDYFPTSCSLPPQADYVIGNYSVPMICPNCLTYKNDPTTSNAGGTKNYPGLPHAVEHDFIGHVMDPSISKHSDTYVDPRIKYLKIKDREVYAKVLVHVFRVGERLTPPTSEVQLVYVAYQVKKPNPKPEDALTLACERLDEADPCYAFRATFSPPGKKDISILVLTAKSP
jgi:hypothetical protein